jgi:hypothetical protein
MFGADFWVTLVAASAVVLLGYGFAATRKANAAAARPTRRTALLSSELAPAAAFARLRAASLGRFKLADSDERRLVLVFGSGITPFSWGFFFPVFVTAAGSGSRIEAGIRSRIFQWGPVVSKTHREFVDALERALSQR